MMLVRIIVLLFFSSQVNSIFRKQFINSSLHPYYLESPGSPLFLTSYIEKGEIEQAQKLAEVTGLKTEVKSFSGFLTVNKTFNSNLFFWYFPSKNDDPRDPVLLWLQGGPGGSSLFGLFVENGPFKINDNFLLEERNFSWNEKYNLLFIDNPVGTGFSFTDEKGYSKTEEEISQNLYLALLQFFNLFPDLKGNHLYLAGESYAGKYVPGLAYKIHHQPKPKKIILRGIAIGDGFTDPPGMISSYAEFIHQIGLFDDRQGSFFKNQTDFCEQLIKNKNYKEAMRIFDLLINSDMISGSSFFTNCSGGTDYYNYLNTKQPKEFEYYGQFVNQDHVRRAIHVGSLAYNDGKKVEENLLEDIMKSAKHYLEPIMNKYKVLIYNGLLDIIVANPLTEKMLNNLNWNGKEEFQRTKRIVWKVRPEDEKVAGYVKRVHDFFYVTIREAGHIAPYDQPERCFDMLTRFIEGRPF